MSWNRLSHAVFERASSSIRVSSKVLSNLSASDSGFKLLDGAPSYQADNKKENTVVILGAGIIGASTAYYLTKAGNHRVVLLDRNLLPGRETTLGSGSTLAVNKLGPWNNPAENYNKFFQGLVKENFTPKFHSSLVKEKFWKSWFYNAWRLASKSHYEFAFKKNTDLGILSINLLKALESDIPLSRVDNYENHQYLYYPMNEPEETKKAILKAEETKGYTKFNYQLMMIPDFIKSDSAFSNLTDTRGFIIKTENDMNAHSLKLTEELIGFCREKHPERFTYHGGFKASEWLTNEKGVIIGLKDQNSNKIVLGEQFVVAQGCWTKDLIWKLGIKVPLLAAKGHSLTVDVPPGRPRQKGMIFSMEHFVMSTQLGNQFRISGLVDFMGYNEELLPHRIQQLKKFCFKFYGFEPKDGQFWTGFRPVSPDDMPIMSSVCERRFPNVFVNTGHGSKGISWGLGSGKFLSALINGEKLGDFDPRDFSMSRYSQL